MKTYKDEIKKRLDREEKYREMLFRRGYLFTSKKLENLFEYPFYGIWQELNIGKFYLYVQQHQTVYTAADKGIHSIIIGHAYNPFNMVYDECDICNELIDSYSLGIDTFFDKVNELTGLHIIILLDGEKVIACQDACGLTGCYYGKVNNEIYISEHPQLLADLLDLKFDKTIERLVTSKCYNIGNRHLPGDLSPYNEIKRIGGNTYLEYNQKFSVKRFYPVKPHPEFTSDTEKENGIKEIGRLIHNGIECCTKKWDRCTISLSGGTDSKTTLACAYGLYDKFSYFSFHSKPQELVDANGAKKICEKLGLEHTLYTIPESNDDFDDFDFIKKLLHHNTSYFVNTADNEIRKFIYLHDLDVYDIELKSWASEVARVFLERKYQVDMSGLISPRQCSVFQTRYFGHPSLLKWSDNVYKNFLNNVGLDKQLFNYEPSDMFYWEIRMGCWGVSVISSQQLYHRMTMPMNNRKILELFLSFPHDERKNDSVHKRVMEYMNIDISEADVEIRNLYFHSYRILMEKTYYRFRTIFH